MYLPTYSLQLQLDFHLLQKYLQRHLLQWSSRFFVISRVDFLEGLWKPNSFFKNLYWWIYSEQIGTIIVIVWRKEMLMRMKLSKAISSSSNMETFTYTFFRAFSGIAELSTTWLVSLKYGLSIQSSSRYNKWPRTLWESAHGYSFN